MTLKQVAQALDLSPTTVSLVLNRSPAAASIPAETQRRVFAAAEKLGYRPDFLAQSLRSRRSLVGRVDQPSVSLRVGLYRKHGEDIARSFDRAIIAGKSAYQWFKDKGYLR